MSLPYFKFVILFTVFPSCCCVPLVSLFVTELLNINIENKMKISVLPFPKIFFQLLVDI
jgi:hypothetical protein